MFMHWSWFSEKKYLCHMDFICDFVGWFNLTCNAVNKPESNDSGTMINSLSAPYEFYLHTTSSPWRDMVEYCKYRRIDVSFFSILPGLEPIVS